MLIRIIKNTFINRISNKVLPFLLVIPLFAYSLLTITVNAEATPARFEDGHITYSSSTNNVGNYAGTLASTVDSWNNTIEDYNYDNNVSLSSVTANADVIVSFVGTPPTSYTMGESSIYTDNNGTLLKISFTTGAIIELGFLYVYPASVTNEINRYSNDEYEAGDFSACVLKTTIHEFGHMLGLFDDNYTYESTIMKQGLSTLDAPTDRDMGYIYDQWY